MRLARALGAAALTIGLAGGAPAAQAEPVAPLAPVAHVQVAEKATKVETKLTAKGPKSAVKIGKKITITGKLTRKGKHGYEPLGKRKVEILLPVEGGMGVLGTAKTSKSGKYTVKIKAKKWWVGEIEVYPYYEGRSTYAEAESGVLVLKVKK